MTDTLAVIAGKLSAKAIRAAGAGLGSNLPGRVSRAISSKVLANLAGQARLGVLAVSGTNGKSTTSGLISSILTHAGHKLAHNRQGANLVPGITASLIEAAHWSGRLDVDYCLFETDEAALPLVAKEVKIKTVVVTNLFRDQLDRFGELDTTASLINKGITTNSSHAILNADDPNVAQLAEQSSHLYYGIDSLVDASCNSPVNTPQQEANAELAYCPKCGAEYGYDKFFYGQLGHYICRQCGQKRPQPEVIAEHVEVKSGGSEFDLKYKDQSEHIHLQLPGLFNVYNALSAAALALSLGLTLAQVKAGLEDYKTLFGRSERLELRGKTVLIQLIKNPAGASQAVRAAVSDPQAKLLIALNDNYADGRDVSWIWDADFDQLASHTNEIIVSGVRAYDIAVRCKYAGVPADKIKVIPSLEGALITALEATAPNETLWILPTYTCLLELQKIAKSLGHALSGT